MQHTSSTKKGHHNQQKQSNSNQLTSQEPELSHELTPEADIVVAGVAAWCQEWFL